MKTAPFPPNEFERQAHLDKLGVLDSLPQPVFDHITDLATKICDTPIALISLVDRNRVWFKSRLGSAGTETGRDESLCGHAILNPCQVMEVADASQDPRFADNPLVLGEPRIRLYAGAPIVTADGHALGTVCVVDQRPRVLEQKQRDGLRSLAELVATLLEQERLLREEAGRNSADERRRAQVYQALLHVGQDLKSFVDTHYVYQFVNPVYQAYWQRTSDEIVGHTVADLIGEAHFQSLVKPQIDQALAGQATRFEAAFNFPGRGERQVDVSYLPAHDDAGRILGVVVRVQDIQERRQREDDLKQALASLQHKTLEQERFIHIVSHDLREPINTINNFAGLLAADDAMQWPEKSRRYLNFVCSGGQRMERLLDDLLNYVRLTPQALSLQPVDLGQQVQWVREDLALSLEHSAGQLTAAAMPTIQGDPSLLRVVLQNLVSNALKFVRAGVAPEIHITCGSDGDTTCLTVQDNGIGIPADKLEKIFDMFQRLHRKTDYPGNGLGLSICRRIAELHGGTLHAASVPGEGSSFTLRLPNPVNNIPVFKSTHE